jgi:predicted transposase YbfD/YdcC
MADNKTTGAGTSAGVSNSDRMKKAAATRAITAAQLSKLDERGRYAHKKAMACRRALETLCDHIASGGNVSPALLARVADVESEIGNCLFGI